MRKITIVGALVLLVSPAFAQEFAPNPDGVPGSNTTNSIVQAPLSITQSSDTATITALNTVACPGDDDRYLRRFDLDGEFGIVDEYTIESLDFGIEGNAAGVDADISIYTIPDGAAFEFANMTLIGSTMGVVLGPDLTIQNALVAGVVADPVANDLVVEVFLPDFTQGGGLTSFLGSNPNGQTGPTFLSSPVCGAVEPTDIASLGFPDMHIVMVVNGDVADSIAIVEVPTLGAAGLAGLIGLLSILGVMVMRRRF